MHGPRTRLVGPVEREVELAHLHDVVRQACEGAGTVTYIESSAGTGRSRLLAAAAETARDAGAQVLMASGRGTERLFPFGVALQLFEERWLAADSEEGARLFHGPAAPAQRLITHQRHVAGGLSSADGFEIIHGLFWTARNMTAPTADGGGVRPLALLVDDVHRADRASLGFLAYLSTRVNDLPVALVLASRTGEPATDPGAASALRAAATAWLHPAVLSGEAAASLVATEFPEAEAGFCQACADVSGGNPFLLQALLEEVRRVRPELSAAGASTIAQCVPGSVVEWIRAQLTSVSPAAQALATAVAALAGPAALLHAASIAGLGPEEAARAADALAAIGVLRSGAPLSFTSAMVARAVLHAIPELERDLLQRRARGLEVSLEHPETAPPSPHAAVRSDARTTGPDETPPAPSERVRLAHLAIESGLRREHRTRVTKLGELAWGDGAVAETGPADALVAARVAQALLLVDELELGLEILADSAESSPDPDEGAAFAAAGCRAWMLYHRGEVTAAMTAAQNALDAAPPAVDGARYSFHGVLAACLVQTGEFERAHSALEVLNAPAEILGRDLPLLHDMRAQLSLARNRPEDALADAVEAGRRAEAVAGASQPGLVSWRSTAALAHLALDEPVRARELAEEELELARSGGVTRVVLRALRVVGWASTGPERLSALEEAVALGAEAPLRLEYLHALVDLGAAARRANRRAAARQPLSKALELARELGATPIVHRAEEEMSAGAGRRRHPRTTGMQALTPSERRVALLAAEGRTTRQIASELYVTSKTVEFHLRHIYRKLGVPSTRAALASVLQGDGADASGSL